MQYYALQLTEKDTKGFDPAVRLEYVTKHPRDVNVELSLLNNPALRHLSILAPPKITVVEPGMLEFRVPVTGKTRIRESMRPPRKEIRAHIADTLNALAGYYIDGARMGRPATTPTRQ